MGDRTAISWTEATWNPVTGCTEVSEGCDHCLLSAERWILQAEYLEGHAPDPQP